MSRKAQEWGTGHPDHGLRRPLQVCPCSLCVSSLTLGKGCPAWLHFWLNVPVGAGHWASRGQLLSAWPRKHGLRVPGHSIWPGTQHPEGQLEMRRRDDGSFCLLGLLVLLFCGFESWGFNVKRVLLMVRDDQAPGTALRAGGRDQLGPSLLPLLRGTC